MIPGTEPIITISIDPVNELFYLCMLFFLHDYEIIACARPQLIKKKKQKDPLQFTNQLPCLCTIQVDERRDSIPEEPEHNHYPNIKDTNDELDDSLLSTKSLNKSPNKIRFSNGGGVGGGGDTST